MKKSLFLGFITLAYGMSLQALASDTATLTITGRVVEPTCSTDVVNNTVQQRCGQTLHHTDINNVTPLLHKALLLKLSLFWGFHTTDSVKSLRLRKYIVY